MLMHLKLIARTAPISRMHSPTAASSWRGECSHLIGVCVRCHALVMSPQRSSAQLRSLNGLSEGLSHRCCLGGLESLFHERAFHPLGSLMLQPSHSMRDTRRTH